MQKYSRLVCIDVGKKRIGIAQTDLLQTIASPVGTFSPGEVFAEIKKIGTQAPIKAFVVGWPLTTSGQEGAATEMVEKFIEKLQLSFPNIPVHKVDERYSSVRAKEAMIVAGFPKKKRREKERVDRIAAALILQQYLENNY